jgi:hypothetical protein
VPSLKLSLSFATMAAAALLIFGYCNTQSAQGSPVFDKVTVDRSGPTDPWGKATGDLNGDGKPDLLVGGHGGQGLVWYENPNWKKHVIDASGSFGTDIEVADIDGDGRMDVVSVRNEGLVWYRNLGNGKWEMTTIDNVGLHDIEIADLDHDGRLAIVGRGQTSFRNTGHTVYLYRPRGGNWHRTAIEVPKGEGLKVADLDQDGWTDVVVNGHWLKNPGKSKEAWKLYRFAADWTWPDTYIDVGDINGDGRPDIVMSPSEPAGGQYRLSWFEAPRNPLGHWAEHIVAGNVESSHHFVGLADFDRDGLLDIATATMHQSTGPIGIEVYLNSRLGKDWSKRTIANTGSHNMRIVDVDGDGDPDLFGANWSGPDQQVVLWVNRTPPPATTHPTWRRHVIDGKRPGKAVFVVPADIDGDGQVDIAAGGFWYRNPGRPDGSWERRSFGDPANDLVVLADLDGDGDTDAILTRWRESNPDSRFVFAENQGRGKVRLRTDLPAGAGDFLQGRALGHFSSASNLQLALSWHVGGKGIELLTIPPEPMKDAWKIEKIAPHSQDEALSSGDIDGDGRLDLLLGTVWLRNSPEGWTRFTIDPTRTNPDRNRLADINRDGKLDAVVGFEAISRKGEVIWYEQGPIATQPWKAHLIGTVIGPMSLDVADFDGDGDLDVVVGEHNLEHPEMARLLLFENLDGRGGRWREHVLYTGDEHHDGAIAVDIDGDGDVDMISIGWGHGKVLLYENMALRGTAAPRPK